MSRDHLAPLSDHLHSRATRSLSVVAADGSHTFSATSRRRRSWPALDGAAGAEGLRMTREFQHEPVMLGEVVDALAGTPQGVIVDATVGGGGHAAALLSASTSHRLVGIDRDPDAIGAASARLEPFGARARVVRGRFDEVAAIVAEHAPGEPVSAVLFDLGVSSQQFDDPERGFSYRFDAPLDMRMDPSDAVTAAEIVNQWSEADLAEAFALNGETRFARRIARAIVAARPVATTSQLADLVRESLPAAARQRGGHPAKRVFQALRILVNAELELLGPAVDAALALVVPAGRVAVLSYHSGEDRIVKRVFADAAAGWCTCPPHLPCVCGATPAAHVLTRGALLPSSTETAANPRAASARLRVAERLDAPWRGGQSGEDASGGWRSLGGERD